MKQFAEVNKKAPLYPDVERIENSKLLGKTFVVKSVEFLPSSFGGEFIVSLINFEKKDYSVTLGSKTVVDQLKKHSSDLPFEATLRERKSKDGNMYQVLE